METLSDPDGPERPEDLHEWTARGYEVGEARRWIGAGFALADADRWRTAGVYRPGPALSWRTAGLTPYTVRPLLRAGMAPREAVRWHELGYSHAEAAERHLAGERPHPRSAVRRMLHRLLRGSPAPSPEDGGAEAMGALLAAGIGPAAARPFADTGWAGPEAVPWARAGIDPARALILRELGFTAAEARSLGADAVELLRAWWDAGVPRGEVAAWAVAGFAPAEAARLRARGVDPERARVLRALGGDTGRG
ncbi:hypothetical protein [Nocardiopsis changdeensis]|uniref:hypothetical protein n=1 Tax=Nocardiopsis changdeensis TaxID=2831969 RepID=UPI0021B11CE7|nr:hypothetical protein [Nocardiopsis changdeensis]